MGQGLVQELEPAFQLRQSHNLGCWASTSAMRANNEGRLGNKVVVNITYSLVNLVHRQAIWVHRQAMWVYSQAMWVRTLARVLMRVWASKLVRLGTSLATLATLANSLRNPRLRRIQPWKLV